MIVGPVVRLGDDVNTDLILAGAYLNITDPAELGTHLLENYVPQVADRIVPGTILLAGRSFGGGSSREQAVVAMRARGVAAVVAESFSRIFFRNAVNLALPAVECAAARREVSDGVEISIDISEGVIRGPGVAEWRFRKLAPFIADLLAAGGLEEWTRRQLKVDSPSRPSDASHSPAMAQRRRESNA